MTGKVEKKKGFSVAKNGLLKRCISGWSRLIYGGRVGTKKAKTGVNFAKSKWQNEKSKENLTIFAEKWHFFRRIFGQIRKK